jgi:protein SERAC1
VRGSHQALSASKLSFSSQLRIDVKSIIAVHGIDGHPMKSWTTASIDDWDQTMWLKDLLPDRIPEARIMTFGFDFSSSLEEALSTRSIRENAKALLEALHHARNSIEVR